MGKIIKLYLGKIKKNENIKILAKYKIIIKFRFFEFLIETKAPNNELMLIIIRGNKCNG